MTQTTTNSVPALAPRKRPAVIKVASRLLGSNERPAPQNFILEVNASQGFTDLAEARELALVLKRALGDDKGIKIREVGTWINQPLVQPPHIKSTRGRQESDVTAGTLAKNVRAALNIENVADFPPVIVLEEDIRTWVVDYKTMTENVKALDGTIFGREERVAAFQKAVSDTLAAEALRGISMK
jgi:hypothetical protein